MVVVCWSLKGGVGTTVVAAALALVSSRRGERPLLLGLAGDLPAVLGVDGSGAGVADWCSLADGQVEDAVIGSSGVSPRDTDIRCTFDGDRVTVRITHLVRTEVPLVGPLLRDMTLTARPRSRCDVSLGDGPLAPGAVPGLQTSRGSSSRLA